jgi:hypothetical protein
MGHGYVRQYATSRKDADSIPDETEPYLPHLTTDKPQTPRNTHATVNRVPVPRPASPRLLLRNAEVNKSHRQLVTMQQ